MEGFAQAGVAIYFSFLLVTSVTRIPIGCARVVFSTFAFLCCAVSCLSVTPTLAQDASEARDREQIAADRYLQVLLRRPRPGVALDRVYGYHVQNDSLAKLETQLTDPTAGDPAHRKMVWGLIQLQRGRSADAAKVLAEVESELPDDAACSFYLGRAYLAVGQTENAASAMERAIDRGPSRAEALPMFTELGRIYSRAGELEKSLAVWTRLEKLFPGDIRVGSQIARTMAEEGNFEQAKERYESLSNSARKPEQKIALAVQAAEMRRRMGEGDEATALLEKILARLNPGSWLHTDVRNRIEAGFLKSGDYDALADYYQKQLVSRPDDLVLQTRLARIMVTAGRLTEAKTLLESAVAKAPDDTESRLTLIDVLVSQNDISGASNQFEELAKRDSQNPDHLIRWGQVLLDDVETELDERRNAAAKVWTRLADARSDDAVTLSQIADRMRGIDRTDDAIKLYRSAIEVDPTAPQYREYLGEYLHSIERKTEAIEVWKSIAEGDRRNRDSLVRLAEVLGTFKQPALALQAWNDASEFDLTFTQELRYAAKLAEAKQYEEAIARLDIAGEIAQSWDEQEQLLKDRIAVYQSSGKLEDQIRQTESLPETVGSLRKLALMYGAAGELISAEQAIQKAMALEPDNTDVLLVAADLAERQNRLGDAANLFLKLSSADNRFRTNYLQRVASLQIRLGQTDDAMATCDAIIDANPASSESYQFLARTAFGVNRDEEAIAALRRAMTVAPRDNSTRRMLASHFAERFRTDEAIELYWQALSLEPKTDDKINLIRALAPLYDRKADLDTLIGRIEEINRNDGSVRSTNLMIAAAHESVQDFGAARNAVEQLLAGQPRDVALLETMVRLSDAADEVEMAAEYQERITKLANTPENRFKLVQYQLDAGTIDVAQALSQRLSFLSDPSRLGNMVRSAAGRGDTTTARAICREALRSDDSLWDIKLTLAQLLLMDQSDKDFESNREEAVSLAREVRSTSVASDAPAPTRRKTTSGRTTTNGLPANYRSNPMYWSQSSYQIARLLGVGRYASASYSSSRAPQTLDPLSFGHGRVIAASLVLMNEAIGKTGDDAVKAVEQLLEAEFALPELQKITDASVLWEKQALASVVSMVSTNPSVSPFAGGSAPGATAKAKADELRKQQMRMMWRLAELDPNYGLTPLFSMLSQRMMSDTMPMAQKPDMTPLSEKELEQLAKINRRVQATGMPSTLAMGVPSGAAEMMLQAIMGHEFKLAGQEERAAEFAPKDPGSEGSYDEITGAIQFYLRLDQSDRADKLVEYLLPAARRAKPKASTQSSGPSVQALISGNGATSEFNQRHRNSLVDAAIAKWTKETVNNARRSATLGDGYVNTYTQIGGGYRSVRVRSPLSTRLMDSSLVQSVLAFAKSDKSAVVNSRNTKFELPVELINHLQTSPDDTPTDEQKTRTLVAAYAHWWSDRPERCYGLLVTLCDQFPSDVDLQIERARLASELKQPRLALEALDSFNPLDSRMLVRKEMAAMNLAAEIGDIDRAKTAAERLFGMRLDVQMQLALADQLKRLGLNDQADAMLQRTRSGRAKDENTELQIARAFLAADNKEAAAEVAYSLLRRLSSGRSRNSTNYQRQVVTILKSAGRLEPLIERAKRRVESSPKAIRPKQELADLYVAAGRADDASKVWETLSKETPTSPQQMIARADALVKAKKNKQAMELYLDAFEKDPSRFNNDFYKMSNAARAAGTEATDSMFRRLMKFPVAKIPTYRMDSLARLGSRSELSQAKRDFIGHLLKSPAAQSQVHSIVRGLPTDQRSMIPEYKEALLSAACSSDAFVITSTMWTVRSRSSGGTAIGPLADVLNMIQTDDAARKRFREAATNALENDSQKVGAKFLLALVNTNQPAQLQTSLEQMSECITRDSDDKSEAQIVNTGLLWQTGQVLESVKDVPIEFVIDLYHESKRFDQSQGSGPQYTLDSRLVDMYVKAKRYDDARELLLKLFNGTDYSSQNQYNPGYGDYQELQAYQWIAEKLLDAKAPVDCLVVYYAGLSNPSRFEGAKRWGGSRDYEKTFQEGAKSAVESVTGSVAAQHLIRKIDQWENDIDSDPVDLMESSPETLANNKSPSSLAMAIRIAANDQDSRTVVNDFNARVGELTSLHPESWQLAALELMIAVYMEAETTGDLEKQLFDRLPELAKQGDPTAGGTDRVQARSLMDLYPVARAASRSERASDQAIGERLVDYISSAAETVNDSSIALALAEISGDASQSISRILDVIAAQSKPGTPLNEAAAKQCLQVARDAAKAGDIQTSTRAFTLALGQGPPLRKISTGGDAFAVVPLRNTGSTSTRDQQNNMDTLSALVQEVTQALSEAIGVELRFVPSTHDQQPAPKVDRDQLGMITDAFLNVVVSPGRPGPVFSYPKAIATTSYDRIRSDDDMTVASATMALAIAAKASDRIDEVRQALDAEIQANGNQTELLIAQVQLAFVSENPAAINRALERFTESIDKKLPKQDTKFVHPGPATSITSLMQTDSHRKSRIVDSVLHSIWPVVSSGYLDRLRTNQDETLPEIASKIGSLMIRTNAMIYTDSYTASRHRSIRTRLVDRHLQLAKLYGDEGVIDEYIRSEINSLGSQAIPSGTDVEKYKRDAMQRMVVKMIDEGLTRYMDEVFRHATTMLPASTRNYSNRFEPHVCLAISQLPAEQQLALLEKMTFGRSGKEPVAFFDGLVSYEVPPPLVRRQHPMLDSVLNLQTSTDDYPVVNSLLMLIDAASSKGESDSIAKKLQALKTQPGDQADIGLALLALAKSKSGDGDLSETLKSIQPTLEAVALRLTTNLPKKNDKTLEFPALEAHLVIRAFDAGLSKAVAEPIIRNLKPYAIRGQRNFLVSAIARATAILGVGRTAGGSEKSPLEHFDIVPITARYRGDNARLMPLFSSDGSGWMSGTSGYDQVHLMFKYPLEGEFEFEATIQDGGWGEADIAFGGIIYQANGWQQTAKVLGMGGRGQVDFQVPSIQSNSTNQESVRVSSERVQGAVNGQTYVSDIPPGAYPFASVYHHRYRTTRFRDVRFSGTPTIPDSVNLIDPSMRGWGVLTRGKSIPKMLMPIGPKQNAKKINDFRVKMNKDLAKGPLVTSWSVVGDELHYKSRPTGSRTHDPAGQIQYLRPIQDGESVEIEFYWEESKTEFSPTIGRTILRLGKEGIKPDWIVANGDLASIGFVAASALEPQHKAISPDVVPKEKSWNTLVLKRQGDQVSVDLNGETVVSVPVVGYERPGIYRDAERDVRVRMIKLTGNWPKEVPKELIKN